VSTPAPPPGSPNAPDRRGLDPGYVLRPDWEITPAQAHAMLAAGTLLLVDVRRPAEWDLVRIEGSIHLPLDELERRADEIEPSPGQMVAMLCHHGVRSMRAAGALRAVATQGRPELSRTMSVAGGIEAWALGIDPSLPRY
jgi:rhodanese-related sulfurtransferase